MTSNEEYANLKTSGIGVSGLEEYPRDNNETLSSIISALGENSIWKNDSETKLKNDSEKLD